MTKEELKEAIAATITENGQKGITGQALANLLNEIVDAAGEGGGGGTLTIAVNQDISTGAIVPISKEKNAQIYKTLVDGLNNDIAYSVAIVLTIDLTSSGMGVLKGSLAVAMYSPVLESDSYIELQTVDGFVLNLYADGTVQDATPEQETSGE